MATIINSKTKKAYKVFKEKGLLVLILKAIGFLWEKIYSKVSFLYLPYCIIRIKQDKNRDIYKLVNFIFSGQSKLVEASQVKEEITSFLGILKNKQPKIILEIGTEKGGTLFLFSRMASSDAKIISVDLPAGKFGAGYPGWRIPLYKSFARENQKLYLVRDDSHNQKTLRNVKKILNGQKADFLFIDGDHTYDGVKKDFEMYSPLVKKGGLIAFHDICPGLERKVGGVPNFWQEIKKDFNYREIVQDWNQGGYGIGIIYY